MRSTTKLNWNFVLIFGVAYKLKKYAEMMITIQYLVPNCLCSTHVILKDKHSLLSWRKYSYVILFTLIFVDAHYVLPSK